MFILLTSGVHLWIDLLLLLLRSLLNYFRSTMPWRRIGFRIMKHLICIDLVRCWPIDKWWRFAYSPMVMLMVNYCYCAVRIVWDCVRGKFVMWKCGIPASRSQSTQYWIIYNESNQSDEMAYCLKFTDNNNPFLNRSSMVDCGKRTMSEKCSHVACA